MAVDHFKMEKNMFLICTPELLRDDFMSCMMLLFASVVTLTIVLLE